MEQQIIQTNGQYEILESWLENHRVRKAMLVCGRSLKGKEIDAALENAARRLGGRIVRFSEFQPNPLYENVLEGVRQYRNEGCDAILAVGGGSAMDVAKCIRLFQGMQGDGEGGAYLQQHSVPVEIPFLAVPTTAGTGSESTRYAVIYYQGEKQSITSTQCLPETVLLDSSLLKTLPDYQKKATMTDALSHAMESFWSVNSTEESKRYSRAAICDVLRYLEGYLDNTDEGNAGMLMAANIAGRAINITQTTAGHAMCYKITGLFGCAHGHAALLCNRILFPWMIENADRCSDPRGEEYLRETLDELGRAMGCENAEAGAERLKDLFGRLNLTIPNASEEQLAVLRKSVNPVRLKNNPIALDEGTIDVLYRRILNGE